MCTWQRALLNAHAAGDATAERHARDVLSDAQWSRSYATEGDRSAVRSTNTDPARLADAQQTWDVNCPGGADDPAAHRGAPPVGQ